SPPGVLPEILKNLLDSRSIAKKDMKNVEKQLDEMKSKPGWNEDLDEYQNLLTQYNVFDKRQLALKVSANSGYGCMGVQKGMLPFMPGAMCTTYGGRCAIDKAANSIQKDHGGVLVYGDSLSADTP